MSDRRHQKLVDNFQYKLIVRIVLYWTIYQVTLFNFLFCWRLLASGKGDIISQYGQFLQEFYPMLICFAILVPVFTWDAVKFYHRIAGPIFRFRSVSRDVAAEKPVRRVKLREGDELIELQDDFNSMLDTLVRAGAVQLIEGKGNAGVDNQTDELTVVSCDDVSCDDGTGEEKTNAAG
jgi:hypothetical protein